MPSLLIVPAVPRGWIGGFVPGFIRLLLLSLLDDFKYTITTGKVIMRIRENITIDVQVTFF